MRNKNILKIGFISVLVTFGLAFGVPFLMAQFANPPESVGPELAFFDQGGQEGVNARVLVPNNFKGAVQVINLIGFQQTPYHPAPGTDATLRLAGITSTTTIAEMQDYAEKLNTSSAFPTGTVVIVGNEMNNLDLEWKANPLPAFNDGAALAREARKYAELYKAFAGALDRNKYLVAPAPPDLYNGNWNPVPWLDAFAASPGMCGAIDTLVANVFDVPSRVGTGNLETHTYLESKLCGKKVTRFGGWGSDPNLSVDAQVTFLNNTPLPAGVVAATTLIVDNCNGNQGNVSKSGWMYYIRGEVFRADGSKVDPKTCTSEGTPFELVDVACNATVAPEFHSLRPYPTSACDRAVSQDVYMCGNDLVVKETLKFTPSDAYRCDELPAPQSGQKCYFFVKSTSKVALGLSAADLPILGNTELVPNSTNGGASGLDFKTRVNEYVSWYLNGIPYRAEEKPQLIGENVAQPTEDESINQILNFAGPLKKLLPRDVQTEERNNERGRIGEERHNQIVECNSTTNPQACYTDSDRYLRITDVPPNPNLKGFPYIPFTSTEDRVGEGKSSLTGRFPDFDCDTATAPTDPNTFGVNCAQFTATNANRNLYFAHTEETKELGTLLQSTFKSYGINDEGSAPLDQFNDQNDPNVTRNCEIIKSRRNPGDKLYGDLERDGTEPINGTLEYTANIICEFKNPDPTEVAVCQTECTTAGRPDLQQCLIDCATPKQECSQEIFVPFKVEVSMPNAHTLYEKFVAGSQSVFKRIFPQVGPNTPVEEIQDIPGRTNASYSSSNQGVSVGSVESTDTLAGDPGQGRPGSTAQIFFPHLGSIYDYFLQGIQVALRPRGMGLDSGTASPTPSPSCSQVNCNQSATLPAQWSFMSNYKSTFVDLATRLTGGKGKHYAAECYNDVVSRSVSRGVNPMFTLVIWLHESGASNYGTSAQCEIGDFGIVGGGVEPSDFNAQIDRFLSLPASYKINYDQCYNQPLPTRLNNYQGQLEMLAFNHIFLNGPGNCVPVSELYYDSLVNMWNWLVPGCTTTRNTKLLFSIAGPQDMSCPRP